MRLVIDPLRSLWVFQIAGIPFTLPGEPAGFCNRAKAVEAARRHGWIVCLDGRIALASPVAV